MRNECMGFLLRDKVKVSVSGKNIPDLASRTFAVFQMRRKPVGCITFNHSSLILNGPEVRPYSMVGCFSEWFASDLLTENNDIGLRISYRIGFDKT